MIKRNEQFANVIINEYKDYGQALMEVENKYNLGKYIKQVREEIDKNGYKPEDVDFMGMIDELEKKGDSKKKLEEEKLKGEKEKLRTILKGFTQEMLILIFNGSTNKKFKKEILEQIKKNDRDIEYLNNLATKSGSIFNELESMSKEELSRLILLRETKEEVNFDNLVLQHLNLDVAKLILKVMNGQSLDEDKTDFCRKHDLANEMEFQIYKDSILNQNFLDIATDLQKDFNNFLNIENDEIINYAYNNMAGITYMVDDNEDKRKL